MLLTTLRWIAWILCFAVAALLSIRNLHEPDIWWMLRTGEWIVNHSKVVSKDTFSYTFYGNDWVNVKWLFEVIVYKISLLGGPEFTLILQTSVNLLLLWFIFKIFTIFNQLGLNKNIFYPTVGLILTIYFTLFSIEYRMIGRPEMVSHLFMLIFFLIFLYYRLKRTKIIYLLIPLQILWTNLHEAFGMGVVIMFSMLGGYLIEYLLKPAENKISIHLILAVLLATIAISINPHGISMLLHPYEIFTQVGDNKFTTELFSYKTNYYWKQKEAYLLLIYFIIGLIGFIGLWKRQNVSLKLYTLLNPLGAGYFILFILFFYLALTAHRNIVFFILMSSPLIAVITDSVLNNIYDFFKKPVSFKIISYSILIVIGLGSYFAVATNKYYERFNIHEKYGLLVAADKNPTGASNFIEKNSIYGKAYSDYLTSSYYMWNLRPEFKTYVDLRDLDVFPAEFITKTNQELFYPKVWEESNRKYKFDYVALYRPIGSNLHKYLYQNPEWKMVYADPVSVLYLPKSKSDSLYQKDVFYEPFFIRPSLLANGVSKLFWPFYEPKQPDVNTDFIAASFYKSIGDTESATKRINKMLINPYKKYDGLKLGGELYYELALQQTNNQDKVIYLNKAQEYYIEAMNSFKNKPGGYEGLGKLFLINGDLQQAENYLLKAISLSEKPDVVLLTTMAECQRYLMEAKPQFEQFYFDKWLEYSIQAYTIDPDNEQIKFTIGLAYCNRNDCENAKAYLEDVSGYPGISQQEMQLLFQCKQRCGIK